MGHDGRVTYLGIRGQPKPSHPGTSTQIAALFRSAQATDKVTKSAVEKLMERR